MTSPGLPEFLLARFAEDEAAAQAAATPAWPWTYDGGWTIGEPYAGIVEGSDAGQQVLPHIARHDPARVLDKCKADRRIVELHREVHSKVEFTGYPRELTNHCSEGCETGGILRDDVYYIKLRERPRWPCPTLRLLALPHADHPDYDESWRP